MREDIVIIGGGLAGSEAAWQAANRGAKVTLYEMRPKEMTQAHKTGGLAELVCSNSLGSADPLNAPGILKEEMRRSTRSLFGWRMKYGCRQDRPWPSIASSFHSNHPGAGRTSEYSHSA